MMFIPALMVQPGAGITDIFSFRIVWAACPLTLFSTACFAWGTACFALGTAYFAGGTAYFAVGTAYFAGL